MDSLIFADNIFTFTDKRTIEKTDKGPDQLSQDSELLKWLESAKIEEIEEDKESRLEKPALAGPSATDEEDTTRQRGDVSLYFYYIKSTGWALIIPWLVSMAFAAVTDRTPCESRSTLYYTRYMPRQTDTHLSVIFLRIWMGKDPQNNLYFIGYALLGVMTIVVPCSTIG